MSGKCSASAASVFYICSFIYVCFHISYAFALFMFACLGVILCRLLPFCCGCAFVYLISLLLAFSFAMSFGAIR